MKKIITLLLALTMVLILAACSSKQSTNGGQDTSISSGSDNITSPEEPSPESPVKKSLGNFSAQDFEGNTITKDIFADYDLTMVNLWTTACGYCIEEMPTLNELRKELQDGSKSFNIISVCMDIGNTDERKDANFEKAKEIIQTTGVEYPNLIPDSVLLEGRLKGIQAYPESFFVDSKGNVVSEPYVGALPKNHWKVTMNNEIEKISQSGGKE